MLLHSSTVAIMGLELSDVLEWSKAEAKWDLEDHGMTMKAELNPEILVGEGKSEEKRNGLGHWTPH
jgi:hypothetical protein